MPPVLCFEEKKLEGRRLDLLLSLTPILSLFTHKQLKTVNIFHATWEVNGLADLFLVLL